MKIAEPAQLFPFPQGKSAEEQSILFIRDMCNPGPREDKDGTSLITLTNEMKQQKLGQKRL
jgi:hypothetical protein